MMLLLLLGVLLLLLPMLLLVLLLTWHLALFPVYALHGRLLLPTACTFKVVVPVYSPPLLPACN